MVTASYVNVERESGIEQIDIPKDFIEKLISSEKTMLFYPRIPAIVSSFVEGSDCQKAGLIIKDKIIGINNKEIKYHDQVSKALEKYKDSVVTINIMRDDELFSFQTSVSKEGTIGYYPALLTFNQLEDLEIYKMERSSFSFLGSFPAGYNKAMDKLGGYIAQFKLILSPSSGAYKGVGGFGAIGSLFPAEWDWQRFWNLTAFLSLMLAFMNILPIPALDGGHVMFLIYEIVVGRPAPEKFMEYAQVLGMIILLSLLVFANGNDILRLF
jgi:regulator of sigma E protease